MALLTPVSVPGSAATAIASVAAESGGDTVAFKRDKTQVLLFTKGSGTATITVAAAVTSMPYGRDVAALSSLAISIGANTVRAVPVTAAYVNKTTGLVSITYSTVSNLTVALLEI